MAEERNASDVPKLSSTFEEKVDLEKMEFKIVLEKIGYKVLSENCCQCRMDSESLLFVYYQPDREVFLGENWHEEQIYEIDVPWTLSLFCKKTNCVGAFLGALHCGGHYHNIRVFQMNNVVWDDHGHLQYHFLNPSQILA